MKTTTGLRTTWHPEQNPVNRLELSDALGKQCYTRFVPPVSEELTLRRLGRRRSGTPARRFTIAGPVAADVVATAENSEEWHAFSFRNEFVPLIRERKRQGWFGLLTRDDCHKWFRNTFGQRPRQRHSCMR